MLGRYDIDKVSLFVIRKFRETLETGWNLDTRMGLLPSKGAGDACCKDDRETERLERSPVTQ